ncbi:hypothetical protein Droror1_Dr00006322 [Drosera rotundifolia]
MNRSTSSSQACAACKYQRRRCPPCILAPYFPFDRQKQFLNAHRLFGVSNMTKILQGLSPQQQQIAMSTIIYQSDARATDPVGGCYGIIKDLQRQITYRKAELDLVLQQLSRRKQESAVAAGMMPHYNYVNNIQNNIDAHFTHNDHYFHQREDPRFKGHAEPHYGSSFKALQIHDGMANGIHSGVHHHPTNQSDQMISFEEGNNVLKLHHDPFPDHQDHGHDSRTAQPLADSVG